MRPVSPWLQQRTRPISELFFSINPITPYDYLIPSADRHIRIRSYNIEQRLEGEGAQNITFKLEIQKCQLYCGELRNLRH